MDVLILAGLGVLGAANLGVGIAVLSRLSTNRRTDRAVRDELARGREESARSARDLREELMGGLDTLADSLQHRVTELTTLQSSRLDGFAAGLTRLTHTTQQGMDRSRNAVDRQLSLLRSENGAKLEQMRATVDEKLHATLEARLGESFKMVGDRLEAVHKGLGEMRQLATGVGDLKRVLTNVKTRGTWGEVQLGNLLEQMLTPDQYAANVAVDPQSTERVDFAVKLPGRDGVGGAPVWLPIDAKFPQEDYQRLLEATDAESAARWSAAVAARVDHEARSIRQKYVVSPHTTDFAVLFLPTEGLFAEVLRRPGLCDSILRDHRIVLAGPTTLSALLSSLQMGFRTLALEKRSSEVWQVLGSVRTEFGRFADMLSKVQKKLQEASNTVDQAAVRGRAVERTLRAVDHMPGEPAIPSLLPFDDGDGPV
jgi:DNA recombination protein RmuC